MSRTLWLLVQIRDGVYRRFWGLVEKKADRQSSCSPSEIANCESANFLIYKLKSRCVTTDGLFNALDGKPKTN